MVFRKKQAQSPAVTDLPELISWKTADIPCLGCDGAVSELTRDAEGGGGGAGAFAGGACEVEEADLGAETVDPAGPQTGPKG